MTIKEYLEKHNIKMTDFASNVGITFFQLYHIVKGRTPTLVTALKIERATNEEVRCRDMISEKIQREIYNT